MKPTLMLPVAAATAFLLLTGCNKPANDNKTTTPTTPAPEVSAPPPPPSAPSTDAGSSLGNAASDAAITAKVKASLADDAGLKTLKLDVDTKDGVVTITGTVNSSDLKGNITSIAQKVEGVKSVVNNVEVKAG